MDREEAVETPAATRPGGGPPKAPSDEDGSLLLPRRRESPCSCLVVRLCPDQKSTSAHAHVVAGPSSGSSCLPPAAARSPRSSRRCAACHPRPPPPLRAPSARGERGATLPAARSREKACRLRWRRRKPRLRPCAAVPGARDSGGVGRGSAVLRGRWGASPSF